MSIEQGLASRALAGDQRAFRLIYERHAPAVFRFLRDQLGNESAADEATQETFVRAWQAADRFQFTLLGGGPDDPGLTFVKR